jgi:SpoVK/Ycf46/Vps4 family AAA+-type ATPase
MTQPVRNAVAHPNKDAQTQFASLIGLESQKEAVITVLITLLAPKKTNAWLKKHHQDDVPFLKMALAGAPLIVLSGDVGCGKTALALSVATAVSREIDDKILAMETPSDIRGTGLVGDLSARIVAAFEEARHAARKQATVLIIDESDDLATSREQNQAHHEDRAGVNVLLKQLDQISRESLPLAVIMITNRLSALDPAVQRRAALVQRFGRPNDEARRGLLEWMLEGTDAKKAEIDNLVARTNVKPGYTYSDLRNRAGGYAVRLALRMDEPYSVRLLAKAIDETKPSPALQEELQ